MTRREKFFVATILFQALIMPLSARYSYRMGYFTGKEIWRSPVIVLPAPAQPKAQCAPPAPKGAVTL